MVVPVLVFLVVASAAVSRLADAVEESVCEDGSNHVRLECRIVSELKSPRHECYRETEGGILVNQCCCEACVAWTGIQLEVICYSEDDGDSELILSRGDSVWNSSANWTFTVSSSVQGNYECRWSNGSVFANRTIDVDGKWTCVSVRGLYIRAYIIYTCRYTYAV